MTQWTIHIVICSFIKRLLKRSYKFNAGDMRVNETLLPIRNLLSREKYRQVKRRITPYLRSLDISMTKVVVIVQSLSHVQLSVTPWTAACQASLSPSPSVCSNSCPLNRWCHPAISSSATHFSSCLQSSQHQDFFQWVSSSHRVAKVLGVQHQSF